MPTPHQATATEQFDTLRLEGNPVSAHVLAGCRANISRVDTDMLMLHALGKQPNDRAWLRAHADYAPSSEEAARFLQLCTHRLNGLPVAYLIGSKKFYGLNLSIDARVLDPRPDTETLVDWALDLLRPMAAPRVADLGTGSGAIALAIQHNCPQATVLGVDASSDALAVARANAQNLNLSVQFAQGHWCSPLGLGWNMVVSNPPYIAEGDPHMAALRHEPRQALTSGVDGLDDIRHIVAHAPACLIPGGWLLLEHGYDQSKAVHELLVKQGFEQVQSRQDLGGHVRCTGGQWPRSANAG